VLFELQTAAFAREALPMMQTFSKFPPVRRDIAVVVENNVSAIKLLEVMNSEKDKNISEISLFDLYSGKNLAQGKKSLAFRILLQSTERNLTDQEIDRSVNKLVDTLGREFGATLRG